MNPGGPYGILKRPVDAGLVAETAQRPAVGDDRRRRYYQLTGLGREVRVPSRTVYVDRGSQHTNLVYTDRLDDLGAAPSVGSKGDSYDCEQNQVRYSVSV